MIFSAWRPDGGYDYYLSGQRHGIGDDLPEVSMPGTINGIGVPAQDVGRPIPPDARKIGEGAVPRGVMAPMERSQVRGLQGTSEGFPAIGYANAIFFIIVGAVLWDVARGAEWTK
jgi:hypothetical protein